MLCFERIRPCSKADAASISGHELCKHRVRSLCNTFAWASNQNLVFFVYPILAQEVGVSAGRPKATARLCDKESDNENMKQ